MKQILENLIVAGQNGKKTPKDDKKPHASEVRWGDVTTKILLADASRIRDLADEIDAMAEAIKDLKLGKVRVDGVTKCERAEKLIRAYLKAVDVGITNRKHD